MKDHPWLKYYPWKELYKKTLEAPFIPKLGDNFDKRYCEGADKIGDDTKERYEKIIRENNFKESFKNFTIINVNEENNNKEKTDSKDSHSTAKKRSMHMRSTSGMSNTVNNNSNFYSSLKINGSNNQNNNNNSNSNYSNNKNENNLKSSVKVVDKEKRISSSMNSTGMLNSNLRNSNPRNTQSYNNVYGNIPIRNNSGKKILDVTPDKRSTLSLNEARNSAKPSNGRLPNINNIDKLKIRKLISSNNSNLLFKYYKSNSNVTNSSNGGIKSQILNKKN